MSLTDEDKQWLSENLAEQLEAMETRLLTAFQKWASPAEARARAISAALKAIDAEVEYHEDRLKKLENPPAA